MAPTAVTLYALVWLFDHLDTPVRRLIGWALGEHLSADVGPFVVPGTGLAITVVVILLAGAITSNLVGRTLVGWFERLLDRVPLVRTLYSAVKQLIAPFGDEKNPFQTVVMVDFPGSEVYSLGFLIKPNAAVSKSGEPLSVVFVPTNHVYMGHVGLYPPSRIHHVDMTAEEALKYLVSMGNALERRVGLGDAPASARGGGAG